MLLGTSFSWLVVYTYTLIKIDEVKEIVLAQIVLY
jgi:hypothetical protein